jgi:PKD domain
LASRTSWRARSRAIPLLVEACVVLVPLFAALAAAGLALAAPSPPRWLSPRNLSQRGADAVIPDIAVDAKGNAIIAWAQAKGSSWTVESVERPPGGPWSAPRALSQPANHVASPQLAIAGDSVVAVWDRYDGKNLIVQAAVRDPKTRTWSAPTSLSPSGRDAQAPRVAVNARGDAIAVWASVGLTGWTVQGSYRPAGGTWQPSAPTQAPQAGTASTDVVLDADGRAVAVWAATSGSGWRVQSSSRNPDGIWTKVTALSGLDATGSIAPQLALEETGDVLAVWSRTIGVKTVIEAATQSSAKRSWSAAAEPFPVAEDALAPSVVVNRRGDGVIVWTSANQMGLSVLASYRRAGKPWGRPQPVSGTASGSLSPRVAVNARGDALAVWTQSTGSFSRVHASSFSAAGSTWSAARVLSKAGADALTPQVMLDDGGDGAAAWARYNGQSFVIQGDGYDGSGPVLSKLSIPMVGKVGTRLVFTVTPKDVWTTVSTIRWSFGDGAAGSGRATGHAYPRPGRYAAKVTAVDAFGHVTSVRRFVNIAPG